MEPTESPPTTPTPGAPSPIRLVYVLGAGRCGSTLLDRVLGAHPDISSTGELFHFPGNLLGTPQPCSCGLDANACPFWSSVRSEVEQQFPLTDLKKGRRYESTRSLPRTALLAGIPGSSVSLYARRLAVLLRAISTQSQKSIVVDSSKYPSRGLIMWRTRSMGIDVRYIHMIRDGRGLVWSKRRTADGQGLGLTPPEKNAADLAVWWVVSNVLSGLLFRFRRGRYLRIRYEDLMADPARTLGEVGRFVGVDLTDVIALIREGKPLPVGHVVGGNRLRFDRTLVLKADTEWQRNLPREDERTFWGIAGWLARRYGYEARTRDGGRAESSLGSRSS
ncbi:MAG: sulfotransferase [Thermoplasmata archaeon]